MLSRACAVQSALGSNMPPVDCAPTLIVGRIRTIRTVPGFNVKPGLFPVFSWAAAGTASNKAATARPRKNVVNKRMIPPWLRGLPDFHLLARGIFSVKHESQQIVASCCCIAAIIAEQGEGPALGPPLFF